MAVRSLEAPAANGFSSETLLFEAEFGGARPMVVRVQPEQHSIFPDADFGLQFRAMAAVGAAAAPVPVPRVYWYEPDPSWLGAPFYAMDRVDGLVATDNPPYTMGGWVLEAAPDEQEAMWWSGIEALAALHRADWRSMSLDPIPGSADEGAAVRGQIDYYRRFLGGASPERRQPVAEAALEWLCAHLPAQVTDDPVGSDAGDGDGDRDRGGGCVLSWGDARLGNMIFSDFRCAAVLDWEMAAIGPPELDVGWWLWFDRQFADGLSMPRPVGFPSRDETVARYEALTGRRLRDLRWFEIFAGFRFAVILVRLATLLKGADILEVDSDFDRNNLATQLLARELGLPDPATTGG